MCFGTFWMRAYFRSVPKTMLEAAEIDGAGSLRTLFSVALPPGPPAVLTLALLTFMFSWNEFLLPLVMVTDENLRTAPLGLAFFAAQHNTDRIGQAAAAVIVSAPIIVLFLVLPAVVHPGDGDGRAQGVGATMAHVDLGGTWHEASFLLVETYTVEVPRGWRIALDPQPYAEVVRVDVAGAGSCSASTSGRLPGRDRRSCCQARRG